MNTADTLRALLRRWYIVVPGLIIAIAATIGAYTTVQPGYQRTATQLLLPGEGTVPKGTTNPYLFLGGLTQAADVLAQVMKSDQVAGKVVAEYPGTDVVVQRDPTVSGPVIQIIVTAPSDAAAQGSLSALVAQSGVVLDRLQAEQHVTADDMMTISTLTQDQKSTLKEKTRLLISAGVGIGLVILTLLVASLVDGLVRRPGRARRRRAAKRENREFVEEAESMAAAGAAGAEEIGETVPIGAVSEPDPIPVNERSLEDPDDLPTSIEQEPDDREAVGTGAKSFGSRRSRAPSNRP